MKGQVDGSVDRFLGIPYAEPPTGDRRWKEPVNAVWFGVRDAIRLRSECVQVAPGSDSVTGSEDCLYLNVYRPADRPRGSLLPVFLFIHGGSNQDGGGSDYDPTAMAENGVIVVTVNYRLGVFGFLALPALDAEAGELISGNIGIMDQQAAMRWVRQNILSFGGNPMKVTLGGESAGGISVCAQMTSPDVGDLFQQAILQSAYCEAISHQEAIERGARVANAAGCTDRYRAAECLRAIPAETLISAVRNLAPQPGRSGGFTATPNFGNRLLPLEPSTAVTMGRWNHSKILMGANHDEASPFALLGLLAAKVPLPLSLQDYQSVVAQQFGSLAPAVLNEYKLDQYPNPFLAYSGQLTDISPVGCPLTPLSEAFARFADTFRYEFDDPSAPLSDLLSPIGIPLGAYHGAELQYLFKVSGYSGNKTAMQQELARRMVGYWTNFIKHGDPNGDGLPLWPRYSAVSHELLSLSPDRTSASDDFEADHHCAFWASVSGAANQSVGGQ